MDSGFAIELDMARLITGTVTSAVYIYALLDARNRVRYIGQTINEPHTARNDAWTSRHRNDVPRRNAWLRSLAERPEFRVLVIVEDYEADDTKYDLIQSAIRRFGKRQILNSPDYITHRGNRLDHQSAAYRTKQSEAMLGNHNNRNRFRDYS